MKYELTTSGSGSGSKSELLNTLKATQTPLATSTDAVTRIYASIRVTLQTLLDAIEYAERQTESFIIKSMSNFLDTLKPVQISEYEIVFNVVNSDPSTFTLVWDVFFTHAGMDVRYMIRESVSYIVEDSTDGSRTGYRHR